MKIIIPARGGSKRIPNKNITDLCGHPLIHYAIENSLSLTPSVYISTDCPKIKKVCADYPVNIIDRPPELATDEAPTNPVIGHFLANTNVDTFACVQATSPLFRASDLNLAFNKLATAKYDSVIAVREDVEFCWDKAGKPINFSPLRRLRTQDMESWYIENGSFYVTSRDSFFKNNSLIGERVGFIVMPKIDSIDIDTPEDLKLAALILKSRLVHV